jgi:protein-tyrosine phosphatase
MHSKELQHYARLDLGAVNLLGLYERVGFKVKHIEWDDPAHRPDLKRATYAEELARARVEALEAFDKLDKPILLHCSAGIDRSSPVAAYVFHMRANPDPTLHSAMEPSAPGAS